MLIQAAIARVPNAPFSVEDVTLDSPRDDEILVRLVATGVCHTDMLIVQQVLPLPLPIVLGHEGAGVVERVGSAVEGLDVGDHVVLSYGHCGQCKNCGQGHSAYCSRRAALNFKTCREDGSVTMRGVDGERLSGSFFGQSSFATHAVAPAINAVRVRRDAPLAQLGPLGCGFSTGAGAVFNVLRPPVDSTLAVFGAGALGFAAIMAAKYLKVRRIVAIDRFDSRLALARELGATDLIDTSRADLPQALAACGGLDFAIDTTGSPKVIEVAIDALKSPGTCALLGATPESKLQVDIISMIRGKTIMGIAHGDPDQQTFIPKLVDLFMAGDFPIDRLSRFYPLDQINQAVEDSKHGITIKPIVTF